MNWWAILANTAVQAALLAALAFLARSLIVQFLGKDLEAFKANLNANTERTLATYRAELSREARDHQVRFEKLHANRVAAIEALYVKLVETRYTMESFVSAWRPDNWDEYVTVGRQFLELRRELDKRRIHLPEALCRELDECIRILWEPAVAAGIWPGVTNPEQRRHASEAFEKSIKAILDGGSVAVAVTKVEREFRRALEAD